MDSAAEIDKIVWRVLCDSGQTQPPVQVAAIYEHLKIHRDYYNLRDPGVLDKAKYALRVGASTVLELVRKAKLQAALFFDERRVIIDSNLPPIKRDWPACHEATHGALAWHRTYFLGDTAQTLDPDWQEMLEAEANYGASAFMLCGPVFDRESKDVKPIWDQVKGLVSRYGKSIPVTIRRYVQYGPNHVMAMLVSTPPWKEIPEDQDNVWRHFVGSPRFAQKFSEVTASDLVTGVNVNVKPVVGGPAANYNFSLSDNDGEAHEFRAECFFNRYYLITLFVHVRRLSSSGIVVPRMPRLPA
jgi:hypothetical protein